MKKILSTLFLITFLTACNNAAPAVEEQASIDQSSAKVKAPQPFYIQNIRLETDVSTGPFYVLDADTVVMLTAPDGCTQSDSTGQQDLPACNPNGFLIVNESSDDVTEYWLHNDVKVNVKNLSTFLGLDASTMDDEGNFTITFDQLVSAVAEYPDFFAVTPFELSYGTATVNGQEISDQIVSLNEIYIP